MRGFDSVLMLAAAIFLLYIAATGKLDAVWIAIQSPDEVRKLVKK